MIRYPTDPNKFKGRLMNIDHTEIFKSADQMAFLTMVAEMSGISPSEVSEYEIEAFAADVETEP